jgi:glycosyltransferase involved in cell wall biosynthesis
MSHELLYPQHLEAAYFGGNAVKKWVVNRAKEVANNPIGHRKSDAITVLIRTRNDEANIESLLKEIKTQDFAGKVEVILVDTESTDQTRSIAKKHGAKVVPITQKDFTYPKSLNLGFQAATHDAVVCVVGHTNLMTKQMLAAAYQQIHTGAAGAYGRQVINGNASRTERWAGTRKTPLGQAKKMGPGILSGNGCVISKKVWQNLGGFDDAFAHGGEDAELARQMLKAGYTIMFDPVLSTHHSHGLGPINMFRQYKHWFRVYTRPGTFNTKEVNRRRPDLAAKHKKSQSKKL